MIPGRRLLIWTSGNRDGGIRSNLTYIIVTSNMMKIAPYLQNAYNDVVEMIWARSTPWYLKVVLVILFTGLVVPLGLIFLSGLLVSQFINALESMAADIAGIILSIFTCGLVMYWRQRWCYQVFMQALETTFRTQLWQRNTTIAMVQKRQCTSDCMQGGCVEGKCFKVSDDFLYISIETSCKCFNEHVNRRLRLAKDDPSSDEVLVRGNLFTEKKIWLSRAQLAHGDYKKCGTYNLDYIRTHYDMERLMWIESKISTVYGPCAGHVLRKRVNLEEIVVLPVSNAELEKMSNTDNSLIPFRDQMRGQELSVLHMDSTMTCKAVVQLISIIVAIIAIAAEEEQGKIVASVILMTLIITVASRLPEDIKLADIHWLGKDAKRNQNIAMVSVGIGRHIFGDQGTCWSRHSYHGKEEVGTIDRVDNLFLNRSVVIGDRMLCFSRRGTFFPTSECKITNGVAHIIRWEEFSPRTADNWIPALGQAHDYSSIGL